MKILSWNIRGVGRKSFIQHVRELTRNYHPHILVFMETNIKSSKADCIIRKFNYPYFIEIPPYGLTGGL